MENNTTNGIPGGTSAPATSNGIPGVQPDNTNTPDNGTTSSTIKWRLVASQSAGKIATLMQKKYKAAKLKEKLDKQAAAKAVKAAEEEAEKDAEKKAVNAAEKAAEKEAEQAIEKEVEKAAEKKAEETIGGAILGEITGGLATIIVGGLLDAIFPSQSSSDMKYYVQAVEEIFKEQSKENELDQIKSTLQSVSIFLNTQYRPKREDFKEMNASQCEILLGIDQEVQKLNKWGRTCQK